MIKGFGVVLLALLTTVTARPEPQFVYSAGPYLSAYTASAAPLVPATAVAPVVPALTVSAVPGTYSGLYPSSVASYSYGYQSTFSEVPYVNPSANLLYNSAYTSLPYSSLSYTNLPYAPAAFYDYLTYGR